MCGPKKVATEVVNEKVALQCQSDGGLMMLWSLGKGASPAEDRKHAPISS
jgi:hypothetical protein